MKVWLNKKFKGYYPVGVAAVVIADDVVSAERMLNEELKSCGLEQTAKAENFVECLIDQPSVMILCDGNY